MTFCILDILTPGKVCSDKFFIQAMLAVAVKIFHALPAWQTHFSYPLRVGPRPITCFTSSWTTPTLRNQLLLRIRVKTAFQSSCEAKDVVLPFHDFKNADKE